MARLQVGQHVRYTWSGNAVNGIVTEVHDEYCVARFEDDDPNNEGWRNDRRWFLPDGGDARRSYAGPRNLTAGMGRAVPIERSIKPMTYAVGQRVIYAVSSGSEAGGLITDITDRFIMVQLDDNASFRNTHMLRCFNLDGSGTGAYPDYMPEGAKGTDYGSQLEVDVPEVNLWTPTKGREYPPEPSIIYGVFDGRGVPVTSYFEGATYTGYGPSWVPTGKRGMRSDTADDPMLIATVNSFKEQHKQAMKAIDFDIEAEANPLEFLVGLKLASSSLYTDGWYLMASAPSEVKRKSGYLEFNFDYTTICNTIGMVTRNEVIEALQKRPTVTAVDGEIITLDSGFRFAILPRFSDEVKPKIVNAGQTTKALLIDNLVYQRSLRDTTRNQNLNDNQDTAIAA